jgi:hypothetical protein
MTLKGIASGVGLVRSHHLDESEAARVARVRIAHNLALLYVSILFKHGGYVSFGQTRVDAGDEKVGAGVLAFFLVVRAAQRVRHSHLRSNEMGNVPAVAASVGRRTASTRIRAAAHVTSRGAGVVAIIAVY